MLKITNCSKAGNGRFIFTGRVGTRGPCTFVCGLALFWGLIAGTVCHAQILPWMLMPNHPLPNPTKQTIVRYRALLRGIQRGKVRVNAYGVATVPKIFHMLSFLDTVYVTRRPNLVAVLFVNWVGKGSDLDGYMITSRHLLPAELGTDYWGRLHVEGDLTVRDPTLPGGVDQDDDVVVRKEIAPNIYQVSSDQD